ncbi:MAG: hypothetical protein WBW04_07845 [Nitrolancea sp.]
MNMNKGLVRPVGLGIGATSLIVALFSLVGVVFHWTSQSIEAMSALPLLVIALVLLGRAYRGPNAPRVHSGGNMTSADAYSFEHQYYVQQKQLDREQRDPNRPKSGGLNVSMLAAGIIPLLIGLILLSASLH